MDKIDRKILELLQRNGSLSASDIGNRVGLSKAPCWRRIQRLRRTGVIKRTVALLDAKALRVATTVFVTIRTADHSSTWFDAFSKAMEGIPEITELHRMSGDVDYLMRVVVPDIESYDRVYKRLIGTLGFLDVSASFALETIKSTTELPMNYTDVK